MQGRTELLMCFLPHIFFISLALLILGPLLQPGFVLTLDMVFTPQMPWPDTLSASFPFYALLHLLNMIIPADILQKIILLLMLYGGGMGIYCLILYLAGGRDQTWQLAAYGAAIFYVINPFVFTRFMVGHFALLLGIALLPWFLRQWLRMLQHPRFGGAIRAGILIAAIAAVSVHSLIFVAIIIGVTTAAILWQQRQQLLSTLKEWAPYILTVFGIALLLMSYWLVPTILQSGYIAESLQHFAVTDRSLFATRADPLLGSIGTILALYGFWADNQPLYVLPKDTYEWWVVPIVLLWALLLFGLVTLWRKSRTIAATYTILACIGVAGALGFHGHVLASMANWLADNVPFFNGMREAQKFTVLLLLSYVVFIAYVLHAVLAIVQKLWKKLVIMLGFLLLTFSITPGMVWGFGAQLRVIEYPASWTTVNTKLHQDTSHFKVLALPWHHYMNYHFVGRTIASPLDKFFDAKVIVSDIPELGSLEPQVYDADAVFISALIKTQPLNIAKQLASRHIKYVLVVKEADYRGYNDLLRDSALKTLYNSPEIQLFENTLWRN